MQIFDQSGNFLTAYGSGPGSGDEQLDTPTGIAVLANGLAIVIDRGNNRTSVWVEGPFSGPGSPGADPVPSVINDLSDVAISAPAQGSFLRYISGSWTDRGLTFTTRTNSDNLPEGTNHDVQVNCQAGEVVTGGGCGANHEGVVVVYTRPAGSNGWYCKVRNQWGGGSPRTFTAWAICLKTTS